MLVQLPVFLILKMEKHSLSNDNLFKLLRYLRVEYNEFFDNDLLLDKSFQELANDFNKAMFEKDVASLGEMLSCV